MNELRRAYQKWLIRKQRAEWFAGLPKWAYRLLGGHITYSFLLFWEDMAEADFLEIEMSYH